MFKAIKEFFTGKKQESKFGHPLDAVTKPAEAPYKVEAPVVELAPVEVTPTPTPAPEPKPAAMKAKKKPAAKKPAGEKKPKAPRKPKSQKT